MPAHFSFTRTSSDQCALDHKLSESIQPFNHTTDSNVVENSSACLPSQSPYMFNNFHSVPNKVVDIESDLRGQTRLISKCPTKQYNPSTANKVDFKWKECDTTVLTPEYTRIDKPCNIFSGITINRFHPLCDDVQMKIHSNDYIGANTRLEVKDAHKTKEIRPNFAITLDKSKPCMVQGQPCAFVKID